MFISVIIPNYNHAKYLDIRIQSVLKQTFQNFEIIILDDKSQDNSIEIIEKYRNHPKVTHIIINEKNSGSTFVQWQKGISLAKGDYIWIAESDDDCNACHLDTLVKQIEKYPSVSYAYCLSQMIDSNSHICGKKIKKTSDKFIKGKDYIRRYLSVGNPVMNTSSAIFKRDYALSIAKIFMEYKGGGDRLFWIEMAEKGDVIVVGSPNNYFRQHEVKVTPKRTTDGTNHREAFQTFSYMNDHLLLSPLRSKIVRFSYIRNIIHTTYDNQCVKNDLLSLWGYNNSLHDSFFLCVANVMFILRKWFNIHL